MSKLKKKIIVFVSLLALTVVGTVCVSAKTAQPVAAASRYLEVKRNTYGLLIKGDKVGISGKIKKNIIFPYKKVIDVNGTKVIYAGKANGVEVYLDPSDVKILKGRKAKLTRAHRVYHVNGKGRISYSKKVLRRGKKVTIYNKMKVRHSKRHVYFIGGKNVILAGGVKYIK